MPERVRPGRFAGRSERLLLRLDGYSLRTQDIVSRKRTKLAELQPEGPRGATQRRPVPQAVLDEPATGVETRVTAAEVAR